MAENVAPHPRGWMAGAARSDEKASLYSRPGARKYLNAEERSRVLKAVEALPSQRALFALTLAWTGARVSEVLALCPASFQIEAGTITIRTLKRRRHSMREVPIPPQLMAALDRHFGLRTAHRAPELAGARLWPMSRQTAWRLIKRLTGDAGVSGRRASPRGLRHAFGIAALQAGIPLNLVQRWLGHASLATTAIYTDASGPKEAALAARFWRTRDGAIPRETWHG